MSNPRKSRLPPTVGLVSVYDAERAAAIFLFDLLTERPERANISHRSMPTMAEHIAFVESHPYTAWYLVTDVSDGAVAGPVVGAIYLSKQDEIGVFIFARHQRNGYGPAAIRALMAAHPRPRYLANVAPRNTGSAAMFRDLGFREIQRTYEITT